MKKLLALMVMMLMLGTLCLHSAHAKKKQVLRVPGGTSVPKLGMAIDASYDPRFDNFVPGYKILQVAIVNNSFNMIPMDPKKDKWSVVTLEGKKVYPAIVDLRLDNPRAWNALPEKTRNIIAYPLILPIGARQVFDLFVPAGAPLETFRQVNIDINSMDVALEIIPTN